MTITNATPSRAKQKNILKGDKQMKIIDIEIKSLKEYPNNPRHNDAAVDKVAASIREFGFKVPIVIDKNNVIVCGHTRVKAARALGLDKVPCIIADDLTDEQIKAFRVADNKTAELADWDFDKLENELAELADADFDMEQFGFDLDFSDNDTADQETAPQRLADRFIIPPFDVWDAKAKDWLERKKIWNGKIGDIAQARNEAEAYNNDAMNDKDKYKGNGIMPSGVSLLDPVLCEIVMKWFFPTNGKAAFDCFAGDTAFGFVSSTLGAEFTGVELRQEQAAFNQQRVDEYGLAAKYICDDGRNVLNHIPEASQDLFFSCPPYFDLEVYSDDPNDASNQETYEDFYKIVDEAFTNAAKCLKNNRFAVVVCGDVRNKKTGGYYNFPQDIINTFCNNGFVLYNNIKLLTPFGNAQIRAARSMQTRKTTHVYQDILVFYKGDTKKIKEYFEPIEYNEGDFNYESENE